MYANIFKGQTWRQTQSLRILHGTYHLMAHSPVTQPQALKPSRNERLSFESKLFPNVFSSHWNGLNSSTVVSLLPPVKNIQVVHGYVLTKDS